MSARLQSKPSVTADVSLRHVHLALALLSAAFTCCLLNQAKGYGDHAAALTTCGKSRNADPSTVPQSVTARDDRYEKLSARLKLCPDANLGESNGESRKNS